MKPSNFPLRKLTRKATAQGIVLTEDQKVAARAIRTKKDRGSVGTYHL